MGRRVEVTKGAKYGQLVLVAEAAPYRTPKGKRVRKAACLCACGVSTTVQLQHLLSGHVTSCGCGQRAAASASNTTHGQTKKNVARSAEFMTWRSMRGRCLTVTHKDYKDYGGRGITICERWSCFANFLVDMGLRPRGTSIDRLDNNLGYGPDNCRWATAIEQASNTRRTVNLTFNGRTCSVAQWARDTGINDMVLYRRVKAGWSAEKTLTTKEGHR